MDEWDHILIQSALETADEMGDTEMREALWEMMDNDPYVEPELEEWELY